MTLRTPVVRIYAASPTPPIGHPLPRYYAVTWCPIHWPRTSVVLQVCTIIGEMHAGHDGSELQQVEVCAVDADFRDSTSGNPESRQLA